MKNFTFKDLILYEDTDYILVNKPPFFSTLDDRQSFGKQNIISLAREYLPAAQVAHRLDRETSGVLAIAKHPEAYRHLSIQFQNRKVEKIYHALVDGLKEFDQVLVDKPIYALNTGIVKIDFEKGKPAQTYFKTLEIFKKHSLIECRPITGRTHQIRIHLAVLQASITGDEQYGGKPLLLSEIKKKFNLKKDTDEIPVMPRFALHAFKLTFKNQQEEEISLEAPYPKDFKAALNQLQKHKD
ncbi:MAG: RluA family pseudouridine synthase [Microscillaceae bacterium]|nr:RluA family pseudouridine synthase [Microscillaceae bacterium]